MTIAKELAKFISGAEAFHAVAHTYFWSSGVTINILGITVSPKISIISASVNALIALCLGYYAWGRNKKIG
jgi:hypothetical protein